MDRTERVELTTLCMIYRDDEILLQNRVKTDWQGYCFPGGHVEPGESIVDAVIREMREETGLDVFAPKLCGVKQFPIEGGRYLVFLFSSDVFSGTLRSSSEGEMVWVKRTDLAELNTVSDFVALLSVFDRDDLTEFQYIIDDNTWLVQLK